MTDRNPFEPKEPSERDRARIEEYRDMFLDLHTEIDTGVKPSRLRALALTSLEEASMWLTKAIVNEPMKDEGNPHISPVPDEGKAAHSYVPHGTPIGEYQDPLAEQAATPASPATPEASSWAIAPETPT